MISVAARATAVAVLMVAAASSLYAARRPARLVAPPVAVVAAAEEDQPQVSTPKTDRLAVKFLDQVLVPPPSQPVQDVQEGARDRPKRFCEHRRGRSWKCRYRRGRKR
jgi:hypothetical protein